MKRSNVMSIAFKARYEAHLNHVKQFMRRWGFNREESILFVGGVRFCTAKKALYEGVLLQVTFHVDILYIFRRVCTVQRYDPRKSPVLYIYLYGFMIPFYKHVSCHEARFKRIGVLTGSNRFLICFINPIIVSLRLYPI